MRLFERPAVLPLGVKPFALKIFLSFTFAMLTGFAFGQRSEDPGPPPPRSRDSIISIKNLSSQKDTIRTKEVISITIKTDADIDTLKTFYIDGIAVPGLVPWKINRQEKILYFANDGYVQAVLLKFLENSPFEKSFIPVYFGVGNKHHVFASSIVPLYIEVRQKINSWWVFAASLAILILVVAGLRYNILKDDHNLYYSLGRTQLFFWTLLLMIAYLQICFVTDSLPDIPLSVLAIIGISVTTTAASKLIENKTKEGTVIDKNAKSEGWLLDIMSDGSSINIQRFQNVAFNAFFGVIFIQKAISTHLLPDFDSNVLLLLGVSSGAYAGLKMTEAAKEQVTGPVTTNEDLSAPAVVTPAVAAPPVTPTTTTPATDAAPQTGSSSEPL